MVNFSDEAARRKWAALENRAGDSLQRIIQGKASAADFDRVGSLLKEMNSLADDTFNGALRASGQQNKKAIEAITTVLDKYKKDNQETIQRAVSDGNKETLKQLDKLLRAQQQPPARDAHSPPQIVHDNLFGRIGRLLGPDRPMLTADMKIGEDGQFIHPGIFSRIKDTFFPTHHESIAGFGGTTAGVFDASTNKDSGFTVALSRRAESSIVKASTTQTSLFDRISNALSSKTTGKRNNGLFGLKQKQANLTNDDERNRADTWWSSFSDLFGSPGKAIKDYAKDSGGWLETAIAALGAFLLDPQFFAKIFAKGVTLVKEGLGAIKGWIGQGWDYIKQKAGDIFSGSMGWIKDKLGKAWSWASDVSTGILDKILSALGLDNHVVDNWHTGPKQKDVYETERYAKQNNGKYSDADINMPGQTADKGMTKTEQQLLTPSTGTAGIYDDSTIAQTTAGDATPWGGGVLPAGLDSKSPMYWGIPIKKDANGKTDWSTNQTMGIQAYQPFDNTDANGKPIAPVSYNSTNRITSISPPSSSTSGGGSGGTTSSGSSASVAPANISAGGTGATPLGMGNSAAPPANTSPAVGNGQIALGGFPTMSSVGDNSLLLMNSSHFSN